ncbi:hypothetical protein DCAR_0312185 [Daucus carota subsp. sativus]|uniref:Uncharacterized protein n=1 Tax=Daucus carota subsp. sativus TaxID=79200 RepID=A0AAF0WNJ6_DAUCS|nr:hypothetical protein DCAR_0312185 [Daucus carota subsp. sativus]
MKNAKLIFVPAPVRGHLIAMVELAKVLIAGNESLSVTIFIMKFPYDTSVNSYSTVRYSENHIAALKHTSLSPTTP